ncbi:hypothetical protein D3C81_1843350 [compost metagenome]
MTRSNNQYRKRVNRLMITTLGNQRPPYSRAMGTPIRMPLTMKPSGSKVAANTSSRPTHKAILFRVSRSSSGSSSLRTMGVGRNTRYKRPTAIRPSINKG